MPVRIYIDTEVLGPTRVIDGVEHRELIARVATALEDSDVPTEDELSLLQPWLWRQLLWRTVINGQADHSPTPLPLPEHAPDPAGGKLGRLSTRSFFPWIRALSKVETVEKRFITD